jgi:NAD(P)-dependent dehydrogenase (short-subunit alcohol dehydrogenase family)
MIPEQESFMPPVTEVAALLSEVVPRHQIPRNLDGQTALITGGSRGIGRGIALKLAERGARVAITYYAHEDAAHQTVATVRQFETIGTATHLDVGNRHEVDRAIDKVVEELGPIHIFVSNARTEVPTFYAPPLEISDDQWNTALDTQPTAFLHAVRKVSEVMPDDGRIVALTYGNGSRTGGWQPWIAMGAAKAATESLVRYFAVALAKRGITVNAVSPGFIDDSVVKSLPEVAQQMLSDWAASGWTPMRRLGTPADIGNVVALLCSEEASWITGQTIYADGGSSLGNSEVPPALQQW